MKHTVLKGINNILYGISYPGYLLYKGVVALYKWNLPDLICGFSMLWCIGKAFYAFNTSTDDVISILFKYCFIFGAIVVVGLPIVRLFMAMLISLFEPFYNIHMDSKARMKSLTPEKTVSDFIEEMKDVSPYGFERCCKKM